MRSPRIVLIGGVALVAVLAVLVRRDPVPERAPRLRLQASEAEESLPARVEDPSPEIAGSDFPAIEKEFRKYLRGPAADISVESALRDRLRSLHPSELVELLILEGSPLAMHLLLRRVDEGLAAERAAWEEALVLGVERSGQDVRTLDRLAEVSLDRVRDPERRDQAALFLMKKAATDRLLVLAGRFASREAVEEVRAFLWSRVPQRGALEGLGYLVDPREAVRLGSLGPQPSVRRALEIAYERTRDPEFQIALARLGR